MSEQPSSGTTEAISSEDRASALFAQLILQQTNMAMMLLGKMAHPETGQVYKDVEAARLFIDQLEMLETKTRGNLTKDESGLLKHSLMSLRLAFVEAVDSPEPKQEKTGTNESGKTESQAGTQQPPAGGTGSQADDEHRKKFSKKY